MTERELEQETTVEPVEVSAPTAEPSRPGPVRANRWLRPAIFVGVAVVVAMVGFGVVGALPVGWRSWWPWVVLGGVSVVGLVWLFGPRPMQVWEIPQAFDDAVSLAEIKVSTGGADVTVGHGDSLNLLVAETSEWQPPSVRSVRGLTLVEAIRPWYALNFGGWKVALNTNPVWRMTLETTLGNVAANLRELQVSQASLVSDIGDVAVIAPAIGSVSLYISTTLGDVRVQIPEGVAADIRVDGGARSKVRIDTKRYEPIGISRWRTVGFEEREDGRVSLTVETTRGDVTIF